MIAISAAADGSVSGQAARALYATVVGPILLALLLFFLSGLNLSERPTAKKRYDMDLDYEGYQRYLDRTSMLIPFPPQLYARMPTFLKRTVFLEFPIYVFDPAKHSDATSKAKPVGSQDEERRERKSGDGVVNDGS